VAMWKFASPEVPLLVWNGSAHVVKPESGAFRSRRVRIP
jgi:hypothetical protein